MTDRMTSIRLPGATSPGWMDCGLVPPEAMIAAFRERAERMIAEGKEILAAQDGDFRVETFIGPYARRGPRVLQPGRRPEVPDA